MNNPFHQLFIKYFSQLNTKNLHGFVDLNDEIAHLKNFIWKDRQSPFNLSKCQEYSVYEVLKAIATLGISIDPAKKLAYLAGEYDHNQQPVLRLYIGYRGEIALATQFNVIRSATANLVYENDIFKSFGASQEIEHSITSLSTAQRGNCTGGYCRSVLASGEILNSFISIEELDEIARNQIENMQGNTPWNSIWCHEMYRVALYRRAAKDWRQRLYSHPELTKPLLYTDAA